MIFLCILALAFCKKTIKLINFDSLYLKSFFENLYAEKCFKRLDQGSAGQKRNGFCVLLKPYFKISFLDKKQALCQLLNMILFSPFLKKINILNKLKQTFACDPGAAVCQPLLQIMISKTWWTPNCYTGLPKSLHS